MVGRVVACALRLGCRLLDWPDLMLSSSSQLMQFTNQSEKARNTVTYAIKIWVCSVRVWLG